MKEDWQTRRLAEVCRTIQDGAHESPKRQFDAPGEGRFPYITSKNIRTNNLDLNDLSYVERDFHDRIYPRCQPGVGDVFLTKDGANTGNVALNTIDEPISLLSSVCLIKTNPAVLEPAFLCYYLQSPDGLNSITGQMTGAAIKRIILRDIKLATIPVPPLSEQRRIVAILDEAFEAIAAAKANAARNLQDARALFEANLGTVFSQLEGDVVPIGKVGQVFDGPHATPKTVDSGPVFLGIGALQDGEVSLGATRHVTPEDFQRWTLRVKPQPGDFVFSYETRLGQAAVIPDGLECCLGRRMGLVRFNPTLVDAHFFAYQYVAPPYREFLGTKTLRGATVDRISVKDFPSFPVTVPPLDEQQRIVGRLKLLRVQVESLASLYQQKVAALEALKKSLLHQAFTGQLTSRAA